MAVEKIDRLMLSVFVVVFVSSCTYRGAYESFKTMERSKCEQSPTTEYEECIAQSDMSFDEYERLRKEAAEK